MISPLLLPTLALAAVAGAALGWRLTGVRARFVGAEPPAPSDGASTAAVTAVAFFGVTAFLALRPPHPGGSAATVIVAVAYLYFAAISLLLADIDAATHRLPNAIVLPAYPVLGILFAAAGVAGGSLAAFGRAIVGGGILFAFFWLVRALGRGAGGRGAGGRGARDSAALGGGDVKLAGVIGMVLGFAGWHALALGTLAAFVLGGVAAVVLLARGRATRRAAIAFGPFLLAGAWVGIVAGGLLAAG